MITAQELLQAPTGFSWSDISDSGVTSGIEFIEQSNVIERASAIVRGFLDQDPTTTTDTEVARIGSGSVKTWVDREGWLWFRTDRFPILTVTSLKWASPPAGSGGLVYTAVTAANVVVYGEDFRLNRLIDYSQDWTWLRRSVGLIQAVYVNGWPNMLMGAAISAGSNVSIQVDDTTGLNTVAGTIGNSLTIYDGASTEVITVKTVTDATHFVANSVANAHTPGATNPIGISALPADIKQGCIWACLAIARVRGEDAISMDSSGNVHGAGAPAFNADAWARAKPFLQRYQRIA